MSYLTDDDVETIVSDTRLAEFTAESGSTPAAAVVAGLRTDVDDLIDSYLAARYAVPVTSTTDLRTLRPHAKVLFKWACLMRRDATPDEATRLAYEATDRFLRDLQKASASLSPAAALALVPDAEATPANATMGSAEPVASDLAGYL